MNPTRLNVRHFGRVDYQLTWRAMRAFTNARTPETTDELWLVEHPPVYTMGLRGRNGTVHEIHGVPVVYTDRGGDMTYHGPGQVVLYALIDLNRRGIGIKTLVQTLEQTVIDYLSQQGIEGHRVAGAPGIYIKDRKIASLGLRVRQGCSYHGLAFNVDMDLTPFTRIDPCGYRGMEVTQLVDFHVAASMAAAGTGLMERLSTLLGYNSPAMLAPIDLATLAAQDHE